MAVFDSSTRRQKKEKELSQGESIGDGMTEKELKRLTRAELLEMLLEQTKKNDALSEELNAVKAKLASKEIAIANSGSLADAALAVSGIMESAQRAADLYLENLKANSKSGLVSDQTTAAEDAAGFSGHAENNDESADDSEPADPDTGDSKAGKKKDPKHTAQADEKTVKKKRRGLFGRGREIDG